jgi:hypothetical protein
MHTKPTQVLQYILLSALTASISILSAQPFSSFIQNPFSLTFFAQNSMPCFVDLDGDGDMDMMAGSDSGNFRYYQNTGNSSSPSFASFQQNPFGLTFFPSNSTVAFADLDNDGDMDMMSGSSNGNYRYYQNIGNSTTPNFTSFVQNPFQLTLFSSNSAPAFVDLDNDNDFDMMAGSEAGNFRYYKNIGSASNPQFASFQQNPFSLQFFSQNSTPTFVDLDNDGDYDLFSGSDSGNFRYYENTGSAASPSFPSFVTNPFSIVYFPTHSAPAFVDIDNDGDSDLFSGSDIGNYRYYQNISTQTGIEEQTESIFAFPNPSESLFNITTTDNSILELEVFDVSGKKIISTSPLSSRATVDLSNYTKGFYVLKIRTSNSSRTIRLERI